MKFLKEMLSYIIIIALIVIIRSYVVTPVKVNGRSMEPTLYTNEVLILNKINKKITRHDIIVLNDNDVRLVKRVIGLPGEHVKYVDGVLYVNDLEIKDKFAPFTLDYDIKDEGYNVIPNDYYFVIGDNRNNSTDSRIIGLINKKDIIGKTNFRIFPIKNFGKISIND